MCPKIAEILGWTNVPVGNALRDADWGDDPVRISQVEWMIVGWLAEWWFTDYRLSSSVTKTHTQVRY